MTFVLGRVWPVLTTVFLVCGVASAQTGFGEVFRMDDNRSYLGIQMEDVTADNMSRYKLKSEKGAIVRSVTPGSPAADAKLQEDDVILEYAGNPVWSSAQLSRYVQETPPGRSVDLSVSRDGARITLNAPIRARHRNDSGLEVLPRDLFGRTFRFSTPDVDRDIERPLERPRLGVELQPLSGQLAEFLGAPAGKGVLIASVLDGSPGAGKLRSGDVVISADGKPVSAPADLTRIVREKGEGNLELKVIRDKKEAVIVVALPPLSGVGRGVKL